MKPLEKFILALPIIGLILKYQNPFYYKTSKAWDVYQIITFCAIAWYLLIVGIGFNINFK